jgi:uncharacterized protein (TIGR00251 family)
MVYSKKSPARRFFGRIKMMLIRVKVFPNSKKEEIIERSEDSFEVRVKEKPERGLANRKVIRILSSYFNILETRIKLIKGLKEKNKIFKITSPSSVHR